MQQDSRATETPGCVVGVDVGGTNLRVALADTAGTILARWSTSTVGIRSPEKVIRLIHDGVRKVMRQVAAPPDTLKAIATGVPGITDIESGTVVATSYLMGWQNIPLRAQLEQELKLPAAVDNDVNLAAIGEKWAGAARGIEDFVFLAIGTGIGAGIVLNGRPYRGTCWAAGEIGYMLLPGTAEEPAQTDEPGALESLLGGEGIRAQWQNVWSPDRTSLPKELTATEIFDNARGDALAQAILAKSATLLAHAIYNVSRVLNCPLFVLGGAVGLHPSLGHATREILERWDLRGRPRVVSSALGEDAQLLGAIRTALDAAAAHARLPESVRF
ncbi:MAG TPA: ROK family protein [Acidobacteriaceae bacterium]|nr:ROK family protein [Acidobacteriaceae bacterium]